MLIFRLFKIIGAYSLMLLLMSSVSAHEVDLTDIYKKVAPSVVVIRTQEHGPSRRKIGQTSTSSNLGTGVVISADGLIMTAAHVVELADTVIVQFHNNHMISANVVASSTLADVALLQLDDVPKDLVFSKLGNSDQIETGQAIFVVGTPYGLSYTLTVGHISGRRHPKGLKYGMTQIEFLQTDAAINKGNSGGPLFTMQGDVVGIVSHIQSQSGGYEGLGFAASINTAIALLIEHQSFWSGIEFIPIEGTLAQALNIPQEMGLLVQRVAKRSPGARLGLQGGEIPIKLGKDNLFIGGDIILEIDGVLVEPRAELLEQLDHHFAKMTKGTEFTVKVLRSGRIIDLKAIR